MAMEPLIPAPGSTGVCVDSPVRIRRAATDPPAEVMIRTANGDEFERICPDADGYGLRSVGEATDDRGRLHQFRYRPFELSADDTGVPELSIRPARRFAPDTWYRVEFHDGPADWAFRTRPAHWPTDRIRVAADGSGDFCTLQGGIDAATRLPYPATIDVAAGHYREICYIGAGQAPLSIRGAGRSRTVLSYDNNNVANGMPSDSRCRLRRLGDRDLYNGWRANVGVDRPDVHLSDLTLINTTPPSGSQAEAFRGNHDRLLLERVELFGHQDTLRLQGRGFVTAGLITGSVDFVWGTGAGYHWRNEYRSVGPGYVLQMRNPAHERGHVLSSCRFTRVPEVPVGSVHLARADVTAFPHSEVIIIDSAVDDHISSAGWSAHPADEAAEIRFAEHDTVDLRGVPVGLDDRPPYVSRLSTAEAQRWRDPAEVLDGWVPITANPETEVASPGGSVVVAWSAPPGHSRKDSIRLGGVDTPVDSSATTGTVEIPVPVAPGAHRIAYCPADGRSTVTGGLVEVAR